MRKCDECGKVYSAEDATRQQEPMGECHGMPVCRPVEYCPHCGSDEFTEVERCLGCGEYFNECHLDKGFCVKCGEELEFQAAQDYSSVVNGYSAEQRERIRWGLKNERDSRLIDFLREAI